MCIHVLISAITVFCATNFYCIIANASHLANWLLVCLLLILNRLRGKDKSDRATAEQVMDPRTRMILFKLLNRQIISSINGCISTGKEANVYHAATKLEKDRAVKVSTIASNLKYNNKCIIPVSKFSRDTKVYFCMLRIDGYLKTLLLGPT